MILEFSCSNHRSIRDKIIFSTLPSDDIYHEDKIYEINGYKALSSAVIYGANGSGKSNFIEAFEYLKNLVTNSALFQPGSFIKQLPNKLEGFNKESSYSIQFITNKVRYAFGFSIKDYLVKEEYLYYFVDDEQKLIFDRNQNNILIGEEFGRKFDISKEVLRENRLMLSCAANFSSVDKVIDVFNFFNNNLLIYNQSYQNSWMKYSLEQINSNENIKKSVLSFLQDLGTGVKDVKIDIKKVGTGNTEMQLLFGDGTSSTHLVPLPLDESRNLFEEKVTDEISAKIIYDNNLETDLMSEESEGIKKLFCFLCPFIDIVINGGVLICDEIEVNLHESLVYGILKFFMNAKTNQSPQLIFTTHYSGLLNLDLFRKDQIWFTESKKDRSTDLYSLAEIKNVKSNDKFANGYIMGKYGAIPMLNLDFTKTISKE